MLTSYSVGARLDSMRRSVDLATGWEIDGEWWLPSNESQRSVGRLVYSPERGCSLVQFTGDVPVPEPALQSCDFLLGESLLGDNFTCVAVTTRSADRSGKKLVYRLDAMLVFRGVHVPDASALSIRSGEYVYSNLHEWMPRNDLRADHAGESSYIVSSPYNPLWRVKGPDGITFADHICAHSSSERERLVFSRSRGVEVLGSPVCTLKQVRAAELAFRSFAHLLGNVKLERQSERVTLANGDEADVFERYSRCAAARMPLVSFKSVESFSAVFARWLELYPKISSMLELYFVSRSGTLNGDNAFLSIIQAAEGLHRTFYAGSYVDPEEFREKILPKLLAVMPAEVPSQIRDKLKYSLKHANEYSLSARLKSLLDALALDIPDAEKRCQDAANTRNYFSHREKELKTKALSFTQMVKATYFWRDVFAAHVLKLLQVSNTGATRNLVNQTIQVWERPDYL